MATRKKQEATTSDGKSFVDVGINKTDEILVIVESPNKTSTLTSIFKKLGFTNLKVMASVGHIAQIADDPKSYHNTGIYPDDNFKTKVTLLPGKEDVVAKLKAAATKAKWVLLMSDPDREGSSISTHLKAQLKIPEKKYFRVTTHEITASGVTHALEHLGKIDDNLSAAAESRQIVDKMLGYSLSPAAQAELQARSVGRCQSAGLKLIAEREEEIRNFKPEKFFELNLLFAKNKTPFKAKYFSRDGKEIGRIADRSVCDAVIADCVGKPYTVDAITQKVVKENPKPPFTTSTFQQEANRALGLSVDAAMSAAQRLFEGISVRGDHVALITYIRTDDATMSPEFAAQLGDYVKLTYGPEYYAPVRSDTKKGDLTQDAHECLRVVNLDMTPEKLGQHITDNNLLRVYRLIWERTIMSSMAAALISDTQYDIRNGIHIFAMHSREVIFDGYRRVHVSAEDEVGADDLIRETFVKGEQILDPRLAIEEKETRPPPRFTEASFIKELDRRGIGRPSTFATILKTILAANRGYCEIKDKAIVPTDKGMALVAFLDKHFADLINLDYTKQLEESLDKIATGSIQSLDFLTTFYHGLEDSLKRWSAIGRSCPRCGNPLVLRRSKFGPFWGCSGYPQCRYIEQTKKS